MDAGASKAGAPVFLSFGTSTASLTEDESVTFSAVLTDPDGIEDLIGGSLTSDDGTIQYGAFASSAQEGAYSLTLTWKQIDQARAITFKTSQTLAVVAKFFDVGGHEVQKQKTILLTCNGQMACHGKCEEHCTAESTTRVSCNSACAAQQMTCSSATAACKPTACYSNCSSVDERTQPSCATIPAATHGPYSFNTLYCCCEPP